MFGCKLPQPDLSDQSCLDHIRHGQPAFFEHIYTRRHRQVYTYLLHILNYVRDDADQVLGDTFISVFQYTQTHDVTNIKSLLYQTAHNKAIDRMKKKENDLTSIDDRLDITDHGKSLLEEIDATYEQEQVAAAIASLSPTEREVVHLAFFEEKPYDEIAIIVGSNKNTVGTILFQAKKKLRRQLTMNN